MHSGANVHVACRYFGALAGGPYDHSAFRNRPRVTGYPIEVLREWHTKVQQDGEDGLLPNHWQTLDEESAKLAVERYFQLLPYTDMEFVSEKDIASLADLRGWSFRTAQRWLQRVRIGGLWGLTPKYNPLAQRAASPGAGKVIPESWSFG